MTWSRAGALSSWNVQPLAVTLAEYRAASVYWTLLIVSVAVVAPEIFVCSDRCGVQVSEILATGVIAARAVATDENGWRRKQKP